MICEHCGTELEATDRDVRRVLRARLVTHDYHRVGFTEVSTMNPPRFILFENRLYEASSLDEAEMLYRETPSLLVVTKVNS